MDRPKKKPRDLLPNFGERQQGGAVLLGDASSEQQHVQDTRNAASLQDRLAALERDIDALLYRRKRMAPNLLALGCVCYGQGDCETCRAWDSVMRKHEMLDLMRGCKS